MDRADLAEIPILSLALPTLHGVHASLQLALRAGDRTDYAGRHLSEMVQMVWVQAELHKAVDKNRLSL